MLYANRKFKYTNTLKKYTFFKNKKESHIIVKQENNKKKYKNRFGNAKFKISNEKLVHSTER